MAEKKDDVIDFARAKERIENRLVKWFVDDPVMLGVFCLVDKRPDPKQKTMGICTISNPPCIKYNPNFVNSISDERLESVLAQEGFKLLLKHPTTRFSNPKHISSLASNVTVTPMSLGSLLNSEGMDDFYPSPKQFGLTEGEYFEEYFRQLMDDVEDTNQKIKQIWDDMSDKEKQDAIDKAQQQAQQSQQGQGDPQQGQGQQGEGQGQQGQGQGDGQGQQQQGDGQGQGQNYENFENEKDALKEYFNPNGTNNAEWGGNDLFDSEIKQMVDTKSGSTREWGKYTGSHMGEIVAANTAKISWKELVRRFSKSVQSRKTVSSRMRVNRRYDLQYPGQRREYNTKIIFAIDVSGSMSEDDLAEGLAVINSACRHAEITYIMFDTEIKNVEKDFKRAKKTFKIYGRGGTDFQCIVDYANKDRHDGVVIFTDGYASAPTRLTGKTKMLWLLHSKDQKPPVDWGIVAHLDRDER